MKMKEFEKKSMIWLTGKYIIPSILGMLFMSLQSMIDGFFISKYIGENALASLNINMPVISILSAFLMVLGIGAQSLISIRFGENNTKSAKNIFKTAVISSLIISFIAMILGITLGRPVSRLLGASDLLVDNSAIYLSTISCFIPFIGLWFVFDFHLRLLGKPQISFLAMALGAITNIFLDYLLIKVFSLNMMGAALATGLSYSFSFLICSIAFFKKKSKINIFEGKFKFKYLGKMVYNGGSEGINALAGAIVMLVFNKMLMKYVGESGVTAYTTIMYIMQIGFCILMGISDGMRPIVGYNYGACNNKRIKHILIYEAILAFICGLLIFSIMFFGGKYLVQIFVSTPEVVEMTVLGAKICAFGFLINGFNILASGFYTAIDFAKESIIIAMLRGLVFTLLGIFTLPLIFEVNGIWATMVFSEAMTFIVVFIMFAVQLKKRKIFREKSIDAI